MKTLTKADLAQLFHIAPRTVEHWVQHGKLPKPTKVGRRALWDEAVIRQWVASNFGQLPSGVDHG